MNTDEGELPSVEELVAGMAGVDAATRDWATFSLGRLSDDDSPAIRDALLINASDADQDTRDEAICGLARRRDPRALALLRRTFESDYVGGLAFEAASYLADSSLLPYLENYDEADPQVAAALLECDPARRTHRDRLAFEVVLATAELLPDWDIALSVDLHETDLLLTSQLGDGEVNTCDVGALLKVRAGNDPQLAAQLLASDLVGE